MNTEREAKHLKNSRGQYELIPSEIVTHHIMDYLNIRDLHRLRLTNHFHNECFAECTVTKQLESAETLHKYGKKHHTEVYISSIPWVNSCHVHHLHLLRAYMLATTIEMNTNIVKIMCWRTDMGSFHVLKGLKSILPLCFPGSGEDHEWSDMDEYTWRKLIMHTVDMNRLDVFQFLYKTLGWNVKILEYVAERLWEEKMVFERLWSWRRDSENTTEFALWVENELEKRIKHENIDQTILREEQ